MHNQNYMFNVYSWKWLCNGFKWIWNQLIRCKHFVFGKEDRIHCMPIIQVYLIFIIEEEKKENLFNFKASSNIPIFHLQNYQLHRKFCFCNNIVRPFVSAIIFMIVPNESEGQSTKKTPTNFKSTPLMKLVIENENKKRRRLVLCTMK